jgi:hypothetical protein
MELTVVVLIVAAALAFLVRGAARRLTGGPAEPAPCPEPGAAEDAQAPTGHGCGCTSTDCPLVSHCSSRGDGGRSGAVRSVA